VTVDAAEILVEGPWRHRFVAANGARFHVAEAGSGPLVLLLHGFPEFWWAWRAQLPALAEAGYHAVAMDLRGYGASDKPPRGYDTSTSAADVAGVVRALGAQQATIVGHDWGGWIAWSMPGLQPRVTRAIGVLGMAHPLTLRAAMTSHRQRRAAHRLLAFQLPVTPERWLGDKDGVVRVLRAWAGPGWPDAESEQRYTRAMQVPFVAHTSMEYYRWAVRSVWRADGRRFAAAVREPVALPVLQIHGGLDPWILPETAARSGGRVDAPVRFELLPAAGHFLPEEAPGPVNSILVDWLDSRRPARPRSASSARPRP
jgi:pimeloyl-ACP methyl ester carboxylesterase